MLNVVLPLKLRQNLSVFWKLERFMIKMTEGSLLNVANEIFYSVMKNANFMLLETTRRALTKQNIKWLLTRPENHLKSN